MPHDKYDPEKFFLSDESFLDFTARRSLLVEHEGVSGFLPLMMADQFEQVDDPNEHTKHDLHVAILRGDDACDDCGEVHMVVNAALYARNVQQGEVLLKHLRAAGEELAQLDAPFRRDGLVS
jgi:hypothetical protein